jgi:hypothetical protein
MSLTKLAEELSTLRKNVCHLAIMLALTAPLGGPQSVLAANSSDPTSFIMEYYQAKTKVKFPMDLKGFFSKRVCEKQREYEKMKTEKPEEFAMMLQMLQAFGGQDPTVIKVIGKNASASSNERDIYDVEAVEMPAAYKKMITPGATVSLKGQVGLVKEDGELKVDKDYWKFESSGKDGKFTSSSGLNPDKDSEKKSTFADDSNTSSGGTGEGGNTTVNAGFDKDDALSRLMDSWKSKGTAALHNSKGKSIYTVITVDGGGEIVSIKAGGEKPQPVAEKELVAFIRSVQPFKPVPAKYAGQKNIWMMFDWSGPGEAMSGPYYSTEAVPSWVVEKMSGKASAQK